MYKIVLKVPEIIFIIFIFLPIFLIIGGYFPDPLTEMILSMLGLFTGIFWMLGLNDYLDKVNGIKKADWIFISILILFAVAGCRDIYKNFMIPSSIYKLETNYPFTSLAFDLIAAGYLSVKVKKIFYARSIWFIFLEIAAYAFGVATLTPEIKNHYKENKKKLDKIFSGEEENLLH